METARERIRKVLSHQPTEQLAIDFGSSGSTGVSAFCYENLKNYLGIDKEELTEIYDLWLMQANISPAMLERFGGDLLQIPHMKPSFGCERNKLKRMEIKGIPFLVPEAFSPVENKGNLEVYQNGILTAKMPSGGFYFDMIAHPYSDIEEVEEIDSLEINPMPEEEINYLEEAAKRLYETTDKSLFYYYPRKIFEDGIQNWGFEEFLVQMLTNEEMVYHYFERLVEVYKTDLERILSRIGKYIDMIRFVDDLGSQNNTLTSPSLYRDLIKPFHKELFSTVKEKAPDVKVALHSCGSIRSIIPDIIESGVDVLNPVQISADNMNPRTLKEEFGDKIVFWGGGANMQFTAEKCTTEELKAEVDSLIKIFSRDSGYIFSQVHAFQANVKPETVIAVMDTALKYR